MSYYVYILFSNSREKHYIGQTNNLEVRLSKHNSGTVKSTKSGILWKLVWFCEVDSRVESVQLETKIKNMGTRRFLSNKKLLD